MTQIAKVLRMDGDGDLLKVQGIAPKVEYEPGGTEYGYRYEWGVNHYSFTENKEATMEAYGLTDIEWQYWNELYVRRYDWINNAWYTNETS